jgi:hypothetical protein
MDALQTASLEVLEEHTPAPLVLPGALAHPQTFPKTLAINADRRQQGDVALLPADSGIATGRAAFVALGTTQPTCRCVQQDVQGVLHAVPHDPVEVALDPIVFECDDITLRTRCIV